MRKTDKNNNCCTQSCFIQEELIVHWEHVLRHDRHYVCEILIEPYLLLGYIYSTRAAFPLMVSLRLNSHPFCMLPWECQSGCTDESCNKSTAKADAGRDLMCFHHHHHHQRVTYRRSEKSTEIKLQRVFFLLFARTMVIQQVFQHQYDAATPQTHSTKWYRNIRFQTNDKARAPTTAMLIWAVIHVVITVTSTPL